jgi:DNA processing protein
MVFEKDFAGFKLYYQGTWDERLFAKCVAVVGSRRMTEYGRQAIYKIVPELIQKGFTVVSGFMYGVDQTAHAATVEYGGKTIAVLGWGINQPLEPFDQELADKIIYSGGLLISEWQNQKAARWTFPMRNKIVAAISQEVIVVEAALKSGSLITVDMAAKLGKKIWAVPGPITSRVSEGTNWLISTGKADIWTSDRQRSENKSGLINPLLRILENEPLDASEIARKTKISIQEVGTQLSLLTLEGIIEERGGKYYLNVSPD